MVTGALVAVNGGWDKASVTRIEGGSASAGALALLGSLAAAGRRA
ncbi:hypothetical protein [Actinomadura luteofluorescens]